jgi:hypothetical protein
MPSEVLAEYISHLQSRDHPDPILHKMGEKQYFFVYRGAEEHIESDGSKKKVKACSTNLNNRMLQQAEEGTDGVSGPSQKKAKVEILACPEWTSLQKVCGQLLKDHGATNKLLSQMSLHLGRLKTRDPDSHGVYVSRLSAANKLMEDLISFSGCCKSIEPQDQMQSVEATKKVRPFRLDLMEIQDQARCSESPNLVQVCSLFFPCCAPQPVASCSLLCTTANCKLSLCFCGQRGD